MQIAIIGYGKMGKMVEEAAHTRGHKLTIIKSAQEINSKNLSHVDMCIDFTQPKSAVGNIEKLAQLKKNVIVGTTG